MCTVHGKCFEQGMVSTKALTKTKVNDFSNW